MFASLRNAVARNTRTFSSHAEAARKLAALGVKLPERTASTAAAEARKDAVLRSAADPVKKSVFAVLQAAKNAGVSLNDSEAFNNWLSTNVEAEAAVQKLMFPDSFVEYAKDPVRVAVTGAAGNIGYAALFRIAAGQMLGPDQPVILHLLEQGPGFKALDGVEMELQDCAFPLLHGVVKADDPNKGFENVDYALLIGAKPRGPGMERADVLKDNAAIFQVQGKALNKVANKNVKVGVVGNPANTNALIAARNAPDLNPANFTAMTRLDENRAVAQVAAKANVKTTDISRVAIWGNHSATQYADLSHALIGGKWAKDIISDDKWIQGDFLSAVQQRGATVINARGASSAASAANAIIEHMHDWAVGSKGEWASMAVLSQGEYGITEGLYSSFPTVSSNGSYEIVGNVPIDPFSAQKIELSHKELLAERDTVKALLP